MRVFVYFNLHKKLWSVRALEGPCKGRVIAYGKYVLLADAKGKVSQAGRERVLRENRNNVHAGIVGELAASGAAAVRELNEVGHRQRATFDGITYNPRKYDRFVYTMDTTEPFEGSRRVFLGNDRRVFAQTA